MNSFSPGQVEAPLEWNPAYLVGHLKRAGSKAAVQSVKGETVSTTSCAELAQMAHTGAAALGARGAQAGSTVVPYATSSTDWVAAALSVGLIGAILAPLDALTSGDEAREIARQLRADFFVTDRPVDASEELRLSDLFAFTQSTETTPVDPEASLAAAMFRASGTTGTPKVFFLSEANIAFNVAETAAAGLVRESDVVLMPLPMHHVFPWIVGTLVPLTVGATVVLPQSMTGPDIATALKLGKPTVVVGVPKLYEAVLAAIRGRIGHFGRRLLDLAGRIDTSTGLHLGSIVFGFVGRSVAPDLRLLVSGGAKLDSTSRRRLETLGWDVRCGYGLSETAAIFTGELRRKKLGTEGEPLPACQIRIENPNAEGVGEILLRGPNIFAGYIDNPTENARAFDAGGYFRTGDLGRVDGDGFLVVTGRSKEIIVLGAGENLHPEDIEKKYEKPRDVAEIAVLEKDGALVGLVVPDMAQIAKRGAIEPDYALRIALSGVSKTLPSTQRLTDYRISKEALPRTRLGKLRRFKLKELYEQAGFGATDRKVSLSDDDKAWLTVEPRATVWRLLTASRDKDSVSLDDNLALNLGFDSFGWMNFALQIEAGTGVRLEAADIASITTVRDLLETVARLRTEGGPSSAAAQPAELDAAIGRWLAPQSTPERVAGRITMALVAGATKLLVRLKVRGLENIPQTGPALICPNHTSILDPFVVSTSLPASLHARAVWAADAVMVFQSWFCRPFCRPFRVFPADKHPPSVTIGLAREALRQGNLQIWFPEGWRSADGMLLPFQPGIGELVLETQVPVIPTRIEGTWEAWPRSERWPKAFQSVTITYGTPVDATELIEEAGGPEATPASVSSALRARMLKSTS